MRGFRESIQIGFLACALGLGACASPNTHRPSYDLDAENNEAEFQAELATQHLFETQYRLQYLGWQLSLANAPLCAHTRFEAGWMVSTRTDWPSALRGSAYTLFNVDQNPRILAVFADSPAAHADLRPGDRFVAINGHYVDTGRIRLDRQIHLALARASRAGRLDLLMERDGESIARSIPLDAVCDQDFRIHPSMEIGAFTDGQTLHITQGMMMFARNDEDLAFVLGHEMAHGSEGHIDAKRLNRWAGTLAGFALDGALLASGLNTGGLFTETGYATGAEAYSQEFEEEADYVGLYYAARAGFNLDTARDFWRRLGAQMPETLLKGATHPTSPRRLVLMDATRAEIYAKLNAGDVLEPNRQPQTPPAQDDPS
ncbi:M48 family metallopeptidase [Woodsholea maritima]|uniref:M48 family metallopeptidase n=1 Tax=Woodsholea maritima TaxID=240237 RepID=UPI00037122B9|nr:M48 family metallopeptidase [Woodsholea maritima]